MAITANAEKANEHGINQGTLVQHLAHIEASLHALSVKLDSDAGVSGSDFASDLDLILPQLAIPNLDALTTTEIIAEYDA